MLCYIVGTKKLGAHYQFKTQLVNFWQDKMEDHHWPREATASTADFLGRLILLPVLILMVQEVQFWGGTISCVTTHNA